MEKSYHELCYKTTKNIRLEGSKIQFNTCYYQVTYKNGILEANAHNFKCQTTSKSIN